MFNLPVPEDEVVEGSSDNNPIILHGVKNHEFRLLMKVMCTT
jgi:hypothetical protein